MSRHDKYSTFPIACLQLGKALDDVTADEARERITQIVSRCIIELARHYEDVLDSDENDDLVKVYAMAERHKSCKEPIDNDKRFDADTYHAYLAAEQTLGWNFEGNQKQAETYTKELERRVNWNAGKKLTRVRQDLLSQAMTGSLPWRDFAMLAAVYAGCFNEKKTPVRISRNQISAMALGYGSTKLRTTHASDVPQLSDHAASRTIAKLWKRKLFSKASPNGRHMYYSHRMSQDQLMLYVAQIKAARLKKQLETRTATDVQNEVNAAAVASLSPELRKKLEQITRRKQQRKRS